MLSQITSLRSSLFLSELSPKTQNLLARYRTEIHDRSLIIHFASYADRQIAAHALHTALQTEIGLNARLLAQISTLELECGTSWTYRLSPETAIEVMPLPVLSFEKIARELENNWQIVDGVLTKLPAILVAMDTGKLVMASPDIHRVSGFSREELLQLPSDRPFFPDEEEQRYRDAIIDARGGNTVVCFKAAMPSVVPGKRVFENRAETRLIRARWGEVCRLTRFLQLPRAIG